MLDFMQQLKRDALMGVTLPAGRFFKPTPAFFDILKKFPVGWVDAGTGSGELPGEAFQRGIKMMGVDLCERAGQVPNTMIMDALKLSYGPSLWATVCRPNHDGWAGDLVECVTRRGAGVIYVGFEHNLDRDIGDYASEARQHWADVGEEGEGAWLIGGGGN